MTKTAALFFFIVLLFFPLFTESQNLTGADISYQYLGADSFLVTAHFYQDCNGSAISTDAIKVTPSCGAAFKASTSYSNSVDVTPVCKKSCTRCSGGSSCVSFGISCMTATAKVSLKGISCSDYIFSVDGCCYPDYKNPPNSLPLHVEAVLNVSKAGYNSGPVFAGPPPLVFCSNTCISDNQSAYGYGADSVSYALQPIYIAHNTTFTYPSGKSYLAPLAFTGKDALLDFDPPLCIGFHYSDDGQLQFKCPKADFGYVSLSASSWYKDSSGNLVRTGSASRVTTVNVIDCPASSTIDCPSGNCIIPVPAISNINETGAGSINVCSGINTAFSINIRSQGLDSFWYTTDIPALSLSLNKSFAKNVAVNMSWQPKSSDIRNKPYVINIFALNQRCPWPDKANKTFLVYVHDSFPKVSIKRTDSACARSFFTAVADTSLHLKFTWMADGKMVSAAQSMNYTFPYNGKHYMILGVTNKSGCTHYLEDSITINYLPAVDAGIGGEVCPGGSINLKASGGIHYTWDSISGLSDYGNANPTATPSNTTTYYVTGDNGAGCKATDSVKVIVDHFPVPVNTDTIICYGSPVHLSAAITKGQQYVWKDTNGDTVSDSAGLLISSLKKDFSYILYVKDSFSCSRNIPGIIHADKPKVSAGPDISVCFGDSVRLDASGGKAYAWNIGQGLNNDLDKPDPYARPPHKTDYIVLITDSTGCSDKDTVTVFVSNVHASVSGPVGVCEGDSVKLTAAGGKNYSWYPATGLSAAGLSSVFVKPAATAMYYVKVCDSLCGCSKTDSVLVSFKPFTRPSAGLSHSVCAHDSTLIGTDSIAGYSYSWSSNAGTFSSHASKTFIHPQTSATYYLSAVNKANGCAGSDSVQIKVITLDKPQFSGALTACAGDTIPYALDNIHIDYTYTWQPEGGKVITVKPGAVLVAWGSTGTLQLLEMSKEGCRDSISESVTVNKKPVLAISWPKPLCMNDAAGFKDSAEAGTAYSWYFGDGDSATGASASHTYAKAGSFSAILKAERQNCTASANAMVSVHAYPVISPGIKAISRFMYRFSNPDSAGYFSEWNFGDSASVGTASASHIYLKKGSYLVQYLAKDSIGCATAWDSLLIIKDTSIILKDDLMVWPNPFTDDIHVNISVSVARHFKAVLFDERGREVMQLEDIDLQPGMYSFSFSPSRQQLRQGLYFLKCAAGNKISVFRLTRAE